MFLARRVSEKKNIILLSLPTREIPLCVNPGATPCMQMYLIFRTRQALIVLIYTAECKCFT